MPEPDEDVADRARLGRDPGRHVPLAGRGRPARQQDRFGGSPDPPPDRHRRPEPERAQPDPEQGDRDQGPQGPAARAAARGEGGGAAQAPRRARRGRLGQPDPELRPASVPDGQGPPDAVRDLATRRQCSTATSTRSCRPSSSASRPTRATAPREPGVRHRRTAEPDGISIRPAAEADLEACARIWREGIDGYLRRMGFPPVPAENPGLRRLHAHTRSTDPDRFLVAERRGGVATAPSSWRSARRSSAGRCGSCRCCSSSRASRPAGGPGAPRARCCPASLDGRVLATCTDSAQPISNGLYASIGIVAPDAAVQPRRAAARPLGARAAARPASGSSEPRDPPGGAHRPRSAALDRSLLGFAHPEDHAFVQERAAAPLRVPRRLRARSLGYGYAGEIGRIGPIAVREPALLAPVLGHLLTAVEPRGASAVWLPGAADERFGPPSGRASGSRASRPRCAGPALRRLHQIRTNVTWPASDRVIVACHEPGGSLGALLDPPQHPRNRAPPCLLLTTTGLDRRAIRPSAPCSRRRPSTADARATTRRPVLVLETSPRPTRTAATPSRTSTSSSPRAISCSSSARRARASRRS